MTPPASSDSRRRWTTAALVAAALLVVPLLVWLLVPSPRAPTPPRGAAPSTEATTPRAAPVISSAAPRRPAVTRPAATAQEGVPGGVEGEVDDPDGKPVAGATVTCEGEDAGDLAAESDASGRFHLVPEAAGCTAVARKQGYAPSSEEVLRVGSDNRLRLAPPTGIAGTVVDESGAPVMSYILSVASFEPAAGAKDGGAPPTFKLEVDDAEGAFERTDLAPGRYVLAVGVRMGTMARSEGIDVKPGAMTRGVRVVVHPGATVVGTVTDASTHARVDGAMVYALLGGMKTRTTFTHNGDFKVEGAPTEGFELHVFHGAYVEHVSRGLSAPAGGGPLRVDVALEKKPPPSER